MAGVLRGIYEVIPEHSGFRDLCKIVMDDVGVTSDSQFRLL